MFIIGSQPTKSVAKSADSALELADSSPNSNANPANVGEWVHASSCKVFNYKELISDFQSTDLPVDRGDDS